MDMRRKLHQTTLNTIVWLATVFLVCADTNVEHVEKIGIQLANEMTIELSVEMFPCATYNVKQSDNLETWGLLQTIVRESTPEILQIPVSHPKKFFQLEGQVGFDEMMIYCYPGSNHLSDLIELESSQYPGVIKMSGRWVSELSLAEYLLELDVFLTLAKDKSQSVVIQIPVKFDHSDLKQVFNAIVKKGVVIAGFCVGNEVNAFEENGIRSGYDVDRYIVDFMRIASAIRRSFPYAEIIALELSGFENKSGDDLMALWVEPFCAAVSQEDVDRLSIHYYPFTGRQKLWENLYLVEKFDAFHMLLPTNAPPLFIGEFNATYEYEANTTYPGSGGDSMMVALRLPELFKYTNVTAVAHWSLIESPPSTLGLFDNGTLQSVPLFNAYQMLDGLSERSPLNVISSRSELSTVAFADGGGVFLYLANLTPFFLRDVEIVNAEAPGGNYVLIPSFETQPASVNLAPFSLTRITFDSTGAVSNTCWFGISQPTLTNTLPSSGLTASSAFADFSETNLNNGAQFMDGYNQNYKIASGGTFTSDISPESTLDSLQDDAGYLHFNYSTPTSVPENYYHCKVKLPLYSEEYVSVFPELISNTLDYSDGLVNGEIAITLSGTIGANVQVEWCSEEKTVSPGEGLNWNTHRATFVVGEGKQTYTIPLTAFLQQDGGVKKSFSDVLEYSSYLTVGIFEAGKSGTLKIYSIEIRDTL